MRRCTDLSYAFGGANFRHQGFDRSNQQGFGSSNQQHIRRFPAAFTLVEMLVVVGIISLLISMLLPALGKARKQAQQVACMSNLRQIGILSKQYAADNAGWIVATRNTAAWGGSWPIWDDLLRDGGAYTAADKCFLCPSQTYYDGTSGSGPYLRSYAENSNLAEHRWVKWDWVHDLSTLVFVTDSGLGTFNNYGYAVIKGDYLTGGAFAKYQVIFGIAHKGTPNILYGDGHVEAGPATYAGLTDPNLWDPHFAGFVNDSTLMDEPANPFP